MGPVMMRVYVKDNVWTPCAQPWDPDFAWTKQGTCVCHLQPLALIADSSVCMGPSIMSPLHADRGYSSVAFGQRSRREFQTLSQVKIFWR